MFEKKDFFCPLCRSKMIIDGTFEFEDCLDYTYSSDKYVCDNDDCEISHKSFWNDYGDFFRGDLDYDRVHKLFPDDKYATLNSYAKQAETEISKKGLQSATYLSPALTLWWLKPYIEHKYKSDLMGNVIKKSYSLHFLYKSNNSKDYTTHYSSPFRMFFWDLGHIKDKINFYKKKKSRFAINDLIDDLKLEEWDTRWWRICSRKYMKIYYKKTIRTAQYSYDFYKMVDEYKGWMGSDLNKETYSELEKICPTDLDVLDTLLEQKIISVYLDKMIRKRKIENVINNKI